MPAESSNVKMKAVLTDLHKAGIADLQEEGFQKSRIRWADCADLRYRGQSYELTVPLSPDFIERFHKSHERRYGYANRGRQVELVNVRSRFWGRTDKPKFRKVPKRRGDAVSIGTQRAFMDGRRTTANVYDRSQLRSGHSLKGPAIIGEYSSTTLVPHGFRCTIDGFLNMIIQRD